MNLYTCINIRILVNTWKNSGIALTEEFFVTQPGINLSVTLVELITIWHVLSMVMPEKILSDDFPCLCT